MKYSNQSIQYKYSSEQVPPLLEPERRGIAMVVYEATKVSLYSNIRILRDHGCQLPIEIWYRSDEIETSDPIIIRLQQENPGKMHIREIVDGDATHFYVKPYAIYHSHFDQVLFLDSDNTAVRDPTYLFETEEFQFKEK